MLAIMVAPVANVEIDLQFIVTLIAVVIISSFGVAGVGGGLHLHPYWCCQR